VAAQYQSCISSFVLLLLYPQSSHQQWAHTWRREEVSLLSIQVRHQVRKRQVSKVTQRTTPTSAKAHSWPSLTLSSQCIVERIKKWWKRHRNSLLPQKTSSIHNHKHSVTRTYQPPTSCFIPLLSVLTSLTTLLWLSFLTLFEAENEHDDDDDDVEGKVHGRWGTYKSWVNSPSFSYSLLLFPYQFSSQHINFVSHIDQ
jgi:hypothetical protein